MATEPNLDGFRSKFPELSEQTDIDISNALETAKEIYIASNMGILYLAAHILTADARPTDSVGAGGLNVKYAATARGGKRWYESTKYGQLFLQLSSRRPSAIGITTMRTLNNVGRNYSRNA